MIGMHVRDSATRPGDCSAITGADAVTLRDIAAADGVSPALVVRHYRPKDGMREAVDDHVARVFEVMLAQISESSQAGRPLERGVLPTLAEVVARYLPAGGLTAVPPDRA